MKNLLIFFSIFATVLIISVSCEELAEEETPLCEHCYTITYKINTDSIISTSDSTKLCGGDIFAYKNFGDIETDTTVTKHYCPK